MLHPDRFFDPEPAVRDIARTLYGQVKDLPLVCPHGHVDPTLFSQNRPFPDPAQLILIPDHYIFRMLYSQGIPLEELGVPTADGSAVETDSRKLWRQFASHWHLFAGTPTGIWLKHEFGVVFGLTQPFGAKTADLYYDTIAEKLASPEFLPRALFDRFNIEVLSTTDSATDSLEAHKIIRDSDWNGRIIPCFRPDAITNPRRSDWKPEIRKLAEVSGIDTGNFAGYLRAIENRREFFRSMGATSTDHAVVSPWTHRLSESDAKTLYNRMLTAQRTVDENDAAAFEAHMLMEMARMSVEDGMVMQLHAGSLRNHNEAIFKKFGLDKGGDIPVAVEFTRNLQELLNSYGNNSALTLIVFTLDETAYSRELAPLAGHYPAMKLGPAWWFHDSVEGMTRYRQQVTETAGFYNTVGFNDDTRAFLSIPARHDLSRRIDCNMLARLVARHMLEVEEAVPLAKALAHDLAKEAYKL